MSVRMVPLDKSTKTYPRRNYQVHVRPHKNVLEVSEVSERGFYPTWLGWFFHIRSPLFFILCFIFITAFLLLDFIPSKDIRWPPLVVGILFTIYIYQVWIYLLHGIIYEYKRRVEKHPWKPLLDLMLIATITIIQNGLLYSSIGKVSTDAYITPGGTENFGDLSVWRRNFISLYYASETTLTLGTGTVYANGLSDVPVGMIPVFFNLIQSILLYTWVTVGMWVRVRKYNNKQTAMRDQ